MGDRVVAVIPSRFDATRFPGKPLVDLAGTPMVVRVAERAARARRVDEVWVATDDRRIAEVVEGAGIRARMTSEDCASGTDRIAEAITQADLERVGLVVNVQGDEPLIDPVDIDVLIDETFAAETPMGTLARQLDDRARFFDPNAVKVVRAKDGRALYFSRAAVPHEASQPLLHIGLYAYRPYALLRLARAEPSPLEKTERLEQLRALELGMNIHVAMARSATPSIAIDTPEDLERVLRVLEQEQTSASA